MVLVLKHFNTRKRTHTHPHPPTHTLTKFFSSKCISISMTAGQSANCFSPAARTVSPHSPYLSHSLTFYLSPDSHPLFVHSRPVSPSWFLSPISFTHCGCYSCLPVSKINTRLWENWWQLSNITRLLWLTGFILNEWRPVQGRDECWGSCGH